MTEILAGFFRHVLTVAAGSLITDGVITADDTNVVGGALAAIVATVWSALQKKGVVKF